MTITVEEIEERFNHYYNGLNVAQALEAVFNDLERKDGYILGNKEFQEFVDILGKRTSSNSNRNYEFWDGSEASCTKTSFKTDW